MPRQCHSPIYTGGQFPNLELDGPIDNRGGYEQVRIEAQSGQFFVGAGDGLDGGQRGFREEDEVTEGRGEEEGGVGRG